MELRRRLLALQKRLPRARRLVVVMDVESGLTREGTPPPPGAQIVPTYGETDLLWQEDWRDGYPDEDEEARA